MYISLWNGHRFFVLCRRHTHSGRINDQVKISYHEIKKKRNSHNTKSECTGLVFLMFTIHAKNKAKCPMWQFYYFIHDSPMRYYLIRCQDRKADLRAAICNAFNSFLYFHLEFVAPFATRTLVACPLDTQINEQSSERVRTLEIESRICRPWIITASYPE